MDDVPSEDLSTASLYPSEKAFSGTTVSPDKAEPRNPSDVNIAPIVKTDSKEKERKTSSSNKLPDFFSLQDASGMLKQKKRRPMLTSSQLSDLFTRLDKNGDGELDLDEFTGIIKMLKINVTPDYVARVFRSVDQSNSNGEVSGVLDMQEFIAAYQKIYYGASVAGLGVDQEKRESFLRATRYGCSYTGNYVFECYTIPSQGPAEKFVVKGLPNDSNILDNVDLNKPDFDHLKKLGAAVAEVYTGGVEDIMHMVQEDAKDNTLRNSSLLWWIDVAYTSVDRTTAEEVVTKFGLPNNSKFLSSFGNFGNGMPSDPKSRVFAGIGNHTAGNVYSLSYFVQAMWIRGVPVVHHLPPWLRSLQCSACCSGGYSAKVADWVVKYYTSRFAWMMNLSWLSGTASDEKVGSYKRAEGLATLLKTSDSDNYEEEDEDDDRGADDAQGGVEMVKKDGRNIFQARGAGVPHRRSVAYDYPPTWLQSNTQLQANPPQLNLHNMSLHVLDHGYGANALLTIRQIDNEKNKAFTLEQQSRAGVLGRIVSGVWVKLAEVTMRGRSSGIAGELTDTPASLVTFLLMLIHNFNMNSSAALDYWLNMLEMEIKDIVVSKHSAHVAEVERILKEFNSYLEPFETIMHNLAKEQEEFSLKPQPAQVETVISASGSPGATLHHKAPLTPSLSGLQRHRQRRKSAFPPEIKYTEALPENIEKVALSFPLIKSFFGADPYREIRASLEGYELLDIKGLVYWKERLRRYGAKVAALKDLISAQLDEKRNFMSFMLTIITTILAPLAILTGYFGMNFDNMEELDHNTYPSTPGVKIMWVICGVCYGALMLVAFHFRVMYSAT